MIKFKRILFPTDFSPAANHALDYAISLALEHEATLILVHVVEDIDFNSPFTLGSAPARMDYRVGIESKLKEEMHNVVSAQLKRQVNVDEVLAWGRPFVEIVRVSKDKGVDLIVIPTHSKPGPKHTHLGSTSARVVSLSNCPVLVVRHPDYEFVSL